MTGDGESPTLRPDYARYILQKEPNAVGLSSVLYNCDWDKNIPASQKLELPSWVPDWHHPPTGAHVSWQVKRSSAGGAGSAVFRILENKDEADF
jgi:hypothetical protein